MQECQSIGILLLVLCVEWPMTVIVLLHTTNQNSSSLIKWNIIHLADASSVRKGTRVSSIIRKIEEFIDMYQCGTKNAP
jgi:hypothetical protein